ncbi:MAG: signal peptidase I, partial [Clostridiales bacterium]|nr:signal peptidase I [Clostridiales bacterium]
IKGGKVYINDAEVPLEDDYLKEAAREEDMGPYFVPQDKYFMLGDNRNYSKDSRYWENKYVEEGKILGKVVFRYFPDFHIFKAEDFGL